MVLFSTLVNIHCLGWWKLATFCAGMVADHGYACQAIASHQAVIPHHTVLGKACTPHHSLLITIALLLGPTTSHKVALLNMP